MLTADEFIVKAPLRSSPHRTTRTISQLGMALSEEPDAPPASKPANSQFLELLCEEIGTGITSKVLERMTEIRLQAISSYLCVMETRGLIEVERTVKPPRGQGGRPLKIYKWIGRGK